MAGGTFKLSQPKVRPGVYANLKNGRQPTASGSSRGTASIPLIGYDWGPRGKWIIISADSPDGHVAELGRSVYDETNSSMIMLQLLLLPRYDRYLNGGRRSYRRNGKRSESRCIKFCIYR